ncbi:hypothetical protein F4808DRAFT_443602 [Astrocystis sublimbata]|nr:hypothetical protein F4808DRAFT_443602 [Astrocystis sublimbata]
MPGVLLFCTAEEAKPFVPQVLATDGGDGTFPYFLVESHQPPSHWKDFKSTLGNDETFATEFIGASVEHCGDWALEQQQKNPMIEQDVIVILDARSVEDHSITLWFYARDEDAELLAKGQEPNAWHDFRIPFKKAQPLVAHLLFGNADESWGVTFHRKGELTDENGIFDWDKCIDLVNHGEGFIEG